MDWKRTAERLETETYPMTAEELAQRVGHVELDLPNGRETLGAVIERSGEEYFGSADHAWEAVYGSVSEKALGRPGYSDRDPTLLGVEGDDAVSF